MIRRSKVLRVAIINAGAAIPAGLVLSFHVAPEPWDMIPIVILTIGCPVAGLCLAGSYIREDTRRGATKWQLILGVVLSLMMFAAGLLLLSSARRSN